MESARRASAIHEQRTGRALRITEADVINEEMYEEINDLPTEYRRLNAHLHTQSAEFDRRLLAYLSCQMATRQAVSDCWQNEQSHVDTRGVNFGVAQGPSLHEPSTSLAGGGLIDHRQVPYPPTTQGAPWRQHGRSTSMYAPGLDQQHPQPSFSSPSMGVRHNSLPSNSIMQPPWTHSALPMDARGSNNMSRVDSAVEMDGSSQHLQNHVPPTINDPKLYAQPWPTGSRYPLEPLSTTVPLDGQQFLPSSPQAFHSNESFQHMRSPSQDFANRTYSYNPNGKQKLSSGSLPNPNQNHIATPTSPGNASAASSPLRFDIKPGSRSSASYEGALTQACHESGGMGPDGTFTRNVLEESSEAIARGSPTP